MNYLRAALSSALIFAVAGCGGGGGNGGVLPLPAASGNGSGSLPQTTTAKFVITVPASGSSAGSRAQYLSPNTESVVVTFVSSGNVAIANASPVTINTYAGASNCTSAGGNLTCSGSVPVQAGADVFNVVAYSGQNGSGKVLSSGQIAQTIGSGGSSVTLSNSSTVALSLAGIVAGASVVLSSVSATAETPATETVTVNALDASGATIIGTNNYSTPITVSIEGDTTHAFALQSPSGASSSNMTLALPTSGIKLTYNGDINAASQIQLVASAQGSTLSKTVFAVNPPQKLLYVLNENAGSEKGATITEYDANIPDYNLSSPSANIVPYRTVNLSPTLAARSIAVDSQGNIYVGYTDTPTGWRWGTGYGNGVADLRNVIDIYAPGASGTATPIATITNNGTTHLFPGALAFDSSGNLYTYADVNGGGPNESLSVAEYAISGSVASVSSVPVASWQVDQTMPNGFTMDPGDDFPSGLAIDAAGYIYENTDYLDGNYNDYPGIYALAPSPSGLNSVSPWTREIDGWNPNTYTAYPTNIPNQASWNGVSSLSAPWSGGLALDASGTIYAGYFVQVNQGKCQGVINVYPAGATSGITDVAPTSVITGDDIVTLGSCPTVSNHGGPYFPQLAINKTSNNTWLFATNAGQSSVAVYPANSVGSVTTAVSSKMVYGGSNTALSFPISIAIGPNPGASAASLRKKSVRQ